MPPESDSAGTALEWLRRARSNLSRARQPKPEEAVWEDLCFDAEQAAEKALKAALAFRRIDFPRTHNLRILLDLLRAGGVEVPPELEEAIHLSVYATMLRYPGEAEPVSEADYRLALETAETVVRWAAGVIGEGIRDSGER
jgi:HEPN domain-containing protein